MSKNPNRIANIFNEDLASVVGPKLANKLPSV